MRVFLAVCAALLLAGLVKAQDNTVFWNTGTTMYVVPTNSSLLITGVCNTCAQPGGTGRTHYDLIENRGTNVVVFDFAPAVLTTNMTIDGVANAVFTGHLLRPLDTYEIPAGKEYNGPVSALCTNGAQGLLAITVSHNQN